jgi:hypothetical protein
MTSKASTGKSVRQQARDRMLKIRQSAREREGRIENALSDTLAAWRELDRMRAAAVRQEEVVGAVIGRITSEQVTVEEAADLLDMPVEHARKYVRAAQLALARSAEADGARGV